MSAGPKRSASAKARRLTDFSRTWVHGRNPLIFSAVLFCFAFVNSRVTEDSISPIRPHTKYLESLCADPGARGRRDLVLLVGSSFARTDCDLNALQSALASRGYPGLKIVSVSVPTLNIQGTDKILKRVLEIPGMRDRLSLAILDHSVPAQTSPLGRFSGRVPQLWLFGDASQLLRQIDVILRSPMPRRTKFDALRERAFNFCKANFHAGWIGSGLRLLTGTTLHHERVNDAYSVEPIAQTRGHAPLRGRNAVWHTLDPARWRKSVDNYSQTDRSVSHLSESQLAILKSSFDRILEDPDLGQTGIISVQYPSLSTRVRAGDVHAALGRPIPDRVLVADFSRPGVYPEFFALKNLHDERHLNAATAKRFARKLADKVVRLYRRNPELRPRTGPADGAEPA